MYDYMGYAGDALADIRLLVEGAMALYETDAQSLCKLGKDNNNLVAANAFNTIGSALYELRKRIGELQKEHFAEAIRQLNP